MNIDLQIKQWIYQASDLIRHHIREKEITYETKSSAVDLVTEVDRAVERFFVNKIKSHYPDHQIIGEEGTSEDVTNLDGYVWIIDPIDGTTNFITQQRDFSISIALYHEQKGILGFIYHVMEDELFYIRPEEGLFVNERQVTQKLKPVTLRESLLSLHIHMNHEHPEKHNALLYIGSKSRGVRSFGSATISLTRVALGQIQGFLLPHNYPWDYAAGKMMVEAMGGVVTDFEGNPLPLDKGSSILACNASIHEELLQYIKKYYL